MWNFSWFATNSKHILINLGILASKRAKLHHKSWFTERRHFNRSDSPTPPKCSFYCARGNLFFCIKSEELWEGCNQPGIIKFPVQLLWVVFQQFSSFLLLKTKKGWKHSTASTTPWLRFFRYLLYVPCERGKFAISMAPSHRKIKIKRIINGPRGKCFVWSIKTFVIQRLRMWKKRNRWQNFRDSAAPTIYWGLGDWQGDMKPRTARIKAVAKTEASDNFRVIRKSFVYDLSWEFCRSTFQFPRTENSLKPQFCGFECRKCFHLKRLHAYLESFRIVITKV